MVVVIYSSNLNQHKTMVNKLQSTTRSFLFPPVHFFPYPSFPFNPHVFSHNLSHFQANKSLSANPEF